MLINIIIDVVLFIVFIGCTLLLLFKKYLRSEYEYIFYTDEVLKVEEVNGLTNYLFEGPAETQQYINEYILCKRKRKKFFMCEYGKDVKSIQYYILAYNANRKLINLIQVKERRPNQFSKMIKLPKKTRAVNFVIHKINGFEVDAHPVRKIKITRIFAYSFFMSLGLFSAINAIRLLILLIAGGNFVEMYLERYGMQGYIYSGILCVVLFIALFFILLFKNRYFARNRGEFYGKY